MVGYHRFGGPCCPEDGDIMDLRNDGTTTSHHYHNTTWHHNPEDLDLNQHLLLCGICTNSVQILRPVLRLSWRSCFKSRSSGLWRLVVW